MGKYSKEIRNLKLTSKNKKCYICEKYENITELHHLVKVSDISKYMDKFEEDNILTNSLRGVYLCPNHHTLLHKLISEKYYDYTHSLTKEEIKKYYALLQYTKELYTDIYDYINSTKYETTLDILKLKVRLDQVCIELEARFKKTIKID